MASELRVYRGSPDETPISLPAPTIGIRLGDLLPLLAIAHRGNYLWLRDFLDDEVRVTSDLYEILQAFQAQRPAG